MIPASTRSRAAILNTLRQGLARTLLFVDEPPARPASLPVPPPGPQPAGAPGGQDAWERLAEALAPLEVRPRLARTAGEAVRHLADIARECGAKSYTRWDEALDALDLPGGFDAALAGLARLPAGPCPGLAQADLGVVLAHAALLESGSIAVVAAPGRHRAASLLPPCSVVLVPRSSLLPDVSHLPGLFARHADPDGRLPSCLNLITGPSSTADIELVLVRGVHGPARLELVCLDWL
jgi:L-lactate dehydrogenase complex protein LldG